jgi:tRNA threonylcarbamoyladenosine biosynthesis protein TsaB
MATVKRLLLIDTVGDQPGVAVAAGDRVLATAEFAVREASAVLVQEIRRVLASSATGLRSLCGIGLVSGPGSFTGVRTGLAVAKGLCEVTGVPLASLSRLQVLAEAAELREGFAVLDAGRGNLHVREQSRTVPAREWLATAAEFERAAAGAAVVVAQESVAERLCAIAPVVRRLQLADLLRPVQTCLEHGGSDVLSADANYVLPEGEIYARQRIAQNSESGSRG